MHRLEQKIREANSENRLALIPFVTAGFPNLQRFWAVLDELDAAGADIIEIGVPFSDPVADGPVIEAASARAIELGVNLGWLLDELKKRNYKAELVLMGYYNTFLQYGLERFALHGARARISGCIVPDLPLGEDGAMRQALQKQGLALISLVGPNTPVERMQEYAKQAKGYVYVASLLGTTGKREELPPEARDTLTRARQIFSLPLALGFGLHSPAQLNALPMEERPEAAIFGSALLQHLEAGGSGGSFIEKWLTSK